MMAILILSCALCLVTGYLVGREHQFRRDLAQTERIQTNHDQQVSRLLDETHHLVGKITGMQRAGFMAVPDEDGQVWQITPEYEQEVEQRRQAGRSIPAPTPAEG